MYYMYTNTKHMILLRSPRHCYTTCSARTSNPSSPSSVTTLKRDVPPIHSLREVHVSCYRANHVLLGVSACNMVTMVTCIIPLPRGYTAGLCGSCITH